MSCPSDLGLLGLGARTTSFYLTCLNQMYGEQFGGDSTCPLTLVNTDFNQINPYLPNQFSKLVPVLAAYIKQLNCRRIIVPNITLHETLDRLPVENLIHPVKQTIVALQRDNRSRITLFGSRHSMSTPYLRTMLTTAGIAVDTPADGDQIWIDTCRKKIYAFNDSGRDIQTYKALLERYSRNTPVVIACTELSLVLEHELSGIYDMTRIQMRAAITQ